MKTRIFAFAVVATAAAFPLHACFARGFGGGGMGGGFHGGGGFGGGGLGGGGFGGGAARGGFGGGGLGGGGFGGLGGGGLGGGGIDRGGPGGFGGGGFDRGGLGGLGGGSLSDRGFGGEGLGGGGFGNLGGRGLGGGGLNGLGGLGGGGLGGGGMARDSFGDRFGGSAPTRSSLNNFLGLPSDEGHNLANNFDVNRGAVEGPRGGYAAGATVTGPGGNTVGRGAAVGPNGGAVAGRGFEGAGGAAGGQAIGVGLGGRVAGGGAVRGPNGGAAARGFVAGPNGIAGGFARVTPSGRYTCAAGVRTNFNHWGVYGRGWYGAHPGAWFCAGWAANEAWYATTWDSLGNYMAYYTAAPVYYDYGNNVTYQDNSVYVNGQDVGTADEYYDQAAQLANTGTQADAPADGDWLPLGVFALSKAGETKSDVTIQLAVNKDGILRGNYTDTATEKTQLIHGSVDKSTQRVAFTVGDNTTNVVETGLYNLTKAEAPCLIHFGKDSTQQWLLVRLTQPENSQSGQ